MRKLTRHFSSPERLCYTLFMDQTPDASHKGALSLAAKRKLAELIRYRPVRWLMRLAIDVLVPRHRIGVALVVWDDRGRILMLHHVFHPLTPWGLPGGWLNRHEDPRAAAERELWEETGLRVEVGPLIYTTYEPRPRRLELAYWGQAQPGPLRLSGEIIEAQWCEPTALPPSLDKHTTEAIAAAIHYQNTQAPRTL